MTRGPSHWSKLYTTMKRPREHSIPVLEPVFRVLVVGPEAVLWEFVARHALEAQAVTPRDGHRIEMALFVDPRQRDELLASGVGIETQIDVRAADRVVVQQVGRGNRFARGGIPPGTANRREERS